MDGIIVWVTMLVSLFSSSLLLQAANRVVNIKGSMKMTGENTFVINCLLLNFITNIIESAEKLSFNPLYLPVLGNIESGGHPTDPRQEGSCTSFFSILYYRG